MILRGRQRGIGDCPSLMLLLRIGRPVVLLVPDGLFLLARSSRGAAAAAVEAGIAGGDIDHRGIVGIVNNRLVDPVRRDVVLELVAAPAAAFIAAAAVAVTIVDAAVVADLRTPVARMEAIAVVLCDPVARRPVQTRLRRLHPGSRHPVITLIATPPITRGPDVAGSGTIGLLVIRQGRRRLVRHFRDRGRLRIGLGRRVLRRIRLIRCGAVWRRICFCRRIGRLLRIAVRRRSGTLRRGRGCGRAGIQLGRRSLGRLTVATRLAASRKRQAQGQRRQDSYFLIHRQHPCKVKEC